MNFSRQSLPLSETARVLRFPRLKPCIIVCCAPHLVTARRLRIIRRPRCFYLPGAGLKKGNL